ncbi:MAG: PKD domain-containing protein [Bradymonadia bacterium]
MEKVCSRTGPSRLLVLLAMVGVMWTAEDAQAQAPEILPVPYAPNNLELPWPVHEYARITLKAIMRNATCGAGYDVAWDTNRNRNFGDETSRHVVPVAGTNTIYDLGRTYEVPTVDNGKTITIDVRAVSRCNPAEETFGTFRMFVYDWTPSSDPTKWTRDQLDIMTTLTVHETLWWLHRHMGQYAGSGGAITAALPHSRGGTYQAAANMAMVWAMTANGRQPAYPPGGINTFGRALPEGWHEANDTRWHDDPYAETIARGLNFSIQVGDGAYLWTSGSIAGSGDEDNTCGWNPDGSERRCNRITNTNNNGGAWIGNNSGTYMVGLGLGSIATVLPSLAGTPVQVGNANNTIRTQPYEKYVQEIVDYLGYIQHDGGCSYGGWLYGNNQTPTTCDRMDASTAQWAYIGLESAEVAGGPYGVIVNNRHKYRIATNLYENQSIHGASSYRTSHKNSSRHDFHLTGGAFVGARWLGIHNMERNNTQPFAPYSTLTQTQLVDMYNRYVSYTSRHWSTPNLQGIHWTAGLFQLGDYLCGTPVGVYNAPTCGYTYAMYSHQKGYRTGSPELLDMGGHDWVTEFNTYYNRAQSRHLNDYENFGIIRDTWSTNRSVTIDYAQPTLTTGWAGLTITPTLFKPKPVPLAAVQPNEVVEGCRGGGAGQVALDHRQSFHPNRDRQIATFQWDVDASDGLWWETGAPVDHQTNNGSTLINHTYDRAGIYTVTLRVLDDDPDGVSSEQTTTTVNVLRSPAAAPSALAGGPYTMEATASLSLQGSAEDANLNCGDTLTATWDLDNDGQYDDANGLNPQVPWDRLSTLPLGVEHTIRLRVVDGTDRVAVAQGTLTIYPRDPIAVPRVNPQPAACLQPVRFNGDDSSHPNPERRIVRYAWDVHPDPGFEGVGGNSDFSYTYNRFSTFPASLTVTDDRGRTHTTNFNVAVTEGNRSPTAATTQAIYTVTDGSSLLVDGSPSSDPDFRCGDSIVEYAWDIDNNGSFDDAGDLRGQRITLPWAVLSEMSWPADRETGDPTNLIALRVTDSQGASHVTQAGIRIYQTRPVPLMFQSPDPGTINPLNNESRITLDARASYSPVPGLEIVEFDWDLNDDGVFETQDSPTTELVRVFAPLPDQPPLVFVRLRVRDAEGRSNSIREQVLIGLPDLTPPTAVAHPDERVGGPNVGGPINGSGGGYHLFVGEATELDASASFDPDPADFIRFYRWDLNDDGVWDIVVEDDDGDGEEAVVDVSVEAMADAGWIEPGTYRVTLEVEDLTGRTNTAETEATLHLPDPVAVAVVGPNPAECEGLVSFDASGSTQPHPEVDVVSWTWDLDGDGEYDDAVGERVTSRFGAYTFDGPLALGLRVEDSQGHSATMPFTVDVTEGNRSPQADASGPYTIALGDSVRVDGRRSRDPDADCDDTIVGYRWDLDGDGTFDVNGAYPLISPAMLSQAGLDAPGQYNITLAVEDRFGRVATDTTRLWISGPPVAVAQASQASAGCNEQVRFSGTNSIVDAPAGDDDFEIVEYLWDMDGDGTFERSGAEISHPIIAQSQVTATLRVVDAQGRSSTDQVTVGVDIANVRPVADAGGPYVTARVRGVFASVDLDARASFDPNAPCDNIIAYAWDTDNDGLYGADDINGAGELNGSDYVGEIIRNYRSPDWRTGTTQVVRVRGRDVFGEWSASAEAEVRVRLKLPPAGELLWPRGGDCVGVAPGPFRVSLRQQGGGAVGVLAKVDGLIVGAANVVLPEDGSALEVEIPINAAQAVEGSRTVVITATNDEGESADITPGGLVAFDRTAPVIGVNPLLVEGACFEPGRVPEASVLAVDVVDPAPRITQEISEDACLRTLQITAVDACGNESSLTRNWLMAEEVPFSLEGPENGDVVPEASFSWDVEAPAACVAGQSASVQVGALNLVYAQGSALALPGQYRFELSLFNCHGDRYTQQRNFRVNNPPIVVAGGPYVGAEGRPITLIGSGSEPPELEDQVVFFEWDMNLDGVYELVGEEVAFVPLDSGEYTGSLRVTDSFGTSATGPVNVSVREVAPIVSPGGPYSGLQGRPIEFDARATRPGSQADLITEYIWDFGDGSPEVSGANLTQPVHTYAQNGVYTVVLTVRDEDGATTQLVPVEIRDAIPIISDIEVPEDIYEAAMWTFSIEAEAGEEGDPLQSITWDFGDGSDPISGEDLNEVQHSWRDTGVYTVTVTVGDTDSVVVQTQDILVRPISMSETLQLVGERAGALDDGPLVASVLGNLEPWIELGLWGESNLRRGNTLVATRVMINLMVSAQGLGARLDDTLWILMRQHMRALDEQWLIMVEPPVGDPVVDLEHPSVGRARDFLDAGRAMFEDPDFEGWVSGGIQAFAANDLWQSLNEAWFYMHDAADACRQRSYNNFAIPDIEDLVDRSLATQPVNDDLNQAIAGLGLELQAYAELDLTGPGRESVIDALVTLRDIQTRLAVPVGVECEDELCIGDRDALELVLDLMDLSSSLYGANTEGVYVRNWQACLAEAVRFRTGLSEMRLEFICGPNNPVTLQVKVLRESGLRLLNERDDVVGALELFQARSTRCTAIWSYNECLVPAFRDINPPYPNPEFCADVFEPGPDDGQPEGD